MPSQVTALDKGPGMSQVLVPEFWRDNLQNYDSTLAKSLFEQAKFGINIGFQGEHKKVISPNWPSSIANHSQVTDFINKNVMLGRIEGPLAHLPEHFRSSPLGAVAKKRTEKIRVIQDLSWPHGESVNDGIDADDYSLHYTSVDIAVSLIQKFPDPWMFKLDLQSAFQSVKVRPEDTHLLGFTWTDKNGDEQLFCYKTLPFGLRSSPWAFNQFADALLFVAKERGLTEDTIHFLDDYWGVTGSSTSAREALNLLAEVVEESGFLTQWEKTFGPDQIIEFLGIILDGILRQMRISQERLEEILDDLNSFVHRTSCTKRQLLSIIGKLMFCSKVIRNGAMFVRRLIHLSRGHKSNYSIVTLTHEAQEDIKWWIYSIRSHNGICMFPVEFDTNTCEIVFSDASGHSAAATYQNHWTVISFTGENEWMANLSICYKEFIAVILCIASFGESLRNKQVLMNIDNQTVIHAIEGQRSKSVLLMKLVRSLYFYTTKYSIQYECVYIPSASNDFADSVSRLEFSRLFELYPFADRVMTTPAKIITTF